MDIHTVAFHGLKRIWEFLDERGLHTDTIDIDIKI